MNKKLLTSFFAAGAIFAINANFVSAEETAQVTTPNTNYEISKPMTYKYIGEVPPALKHMGPGPQINKKHPIKLHGPYELANRQADFEKKLNLTEEQKAKIAEVKKQNEEKLTAISAQIKEKKQQIRDTIENTKLSDEKKSEETAKLLKELDALKLQAKDLRKENYSVFENNLTEQQKKEYKKLVEKYKKDMEKSRKKFEKMKKKHPHPRREIGLPVQPKPQPETK